MLNSPIVSYRKGAIAHLAIGLLYYFFVGHSFPGQHMGYSTSLMSCFQFLTRGDSQRPYFRLSRRSETAVVLQRSFAVAKCPSVRLSVCKSLTIRCAETFWLRPILELSKAPSPAKFRQHHPNGSLIMRPSLWGRIKCWTPFFCQSVRLFRAFDLLQTSSLVDICYLFV